MPEKIKPELLRLLEPSALPCRILVVESLAYLPRLREMFPRAELLACADDPELALAGPAGKFQELEAVDGLFIATQYDIPWREDILTGWHMYDTAMCMEMRRAGYKVAVPNQEEDFWCIHCPKEKPLASSYRGYQKAFLKEYGKELHPEV